MNHPSFINVVSSFFSKAQIRLIRGVRVGIAGAGGIGSNCACALVRCGFEDFIISDFDTVFLSNLNRQAYSMHHIGRSKVLCLKEVLESINPDISVRAIHTKITRENMREIYESCDVIVEAFDDPECKAMLVEEFIGSKKLLVSVSGIGGYGDSDRIRVRQIKENFYIIGDEKSEIDDFTKPYAPCVLIAAAKQADTVLSWVLRKKE